MANERLVDFPAKTSPVPADIIYVGDSAAAYNEVQCTISQIISAYPNLFSIGALTIGNNNYIYTNGTGVYTVGTISSTGVSLLADANAAAMLVTLGLGTPSGTGNVLLQTSPTLITPALGTPASGNLVNCTGVSSTNVAITDDTTTNATMYPLWVTAATGNLPTKVSSTKLNFNPSTGTLTTTTFAGALSGNATSATTATTATSATTATTATNSTNIAVTDDSATNATMYPLWVTANTGNLPAKLSSTKITFNPSTGTLTTTTFAGALSGNATTATSATSATTATTATNATNTAITDDTSTNATVYPTWVTANTGNLPQKTTSTKLSFNPSTGALTSTSFVGALTGNASTVTNGVYTTSSNVVTNAMLSQMATLTIKGNNTGGTANAADLTVAQVKTMLGISSYTVPTVTVYTSGTGTYTTPAGALYLTVEMLGGGGGGGGSGTGSPGNGGAGNNTTFGTTFLVANGGALGGAAGAGGAGGTASGGDINLTGGAGGAGITIGTGAGVGYGGMGGVSVFGGASPLTNSAAIAAAVNSGSGGTGGAIATVADSAGGGGGAGGYCKKTITSSIQSTYSYAVGGTASGGGAGTGGVAGAAGAAGLIIVTAYFQ